MMGKTVMWLAGIVLCLFVLKGLISFFLDGPLHKVEDFAVFYGAPDKKKLKELAEKDAVIVEPTAFQQEEIDFLKSKGVRVFGYVSLMQLENWNSELKTKIKQSDYARLNGERIYIQEWDTYVMDLREKNYQKALLWKTSRYIEKTGMDGVFFDTVDDLDYYFQDDPKVQEQMRKGYGRILQQVHENHPGLLIIQNRGFETYAELSRKKVDGLLWEGFEAEDIESSEWAKAWLSYFNKEQKRGTVRILTVVTNEKSRAASEQTGFPAFVREKDTYQ